MPEQVDVGAVAALIGEREAVEWRIIAASHAVTKCGAGIAALNRGGTEFR
jgi:hypothetical protein